MADIRICASIINNDITAVREIESMVELYEVRIDLIGDGWENLVTRLKKPWIACNRTSKEGGKWQGTEARRIEKLLQSVELGAEIIDIELGTANLSKIVQTVKKRAKCLLSYHDFEKTPPIGKMKDIIDRQIKAGADICKVVTTANSMEDNTSTLRLIKEYPGIRIVSFAMGQLGMVSRILCPVAGGDFTYASIDKGREAAPGQLTVRELAELYKILKSS